MLYIDWEELWDLDSWWSELAVRLWCVLQTLAVGYTSWVIAPVVGELLYDPGEWNALLGGLSFFAGMIVFTVVPPIFTSRMLRGDFPEWWCVLVMAGAVYVAFTYGAQVGAILPAPWQPLGPLFAWMTPCAVLGFPVANLTLIRRSKIKVAPLRPRAGMSLAVMQDSADEAPGLKLPRKND